MNFLQRKVKHRKPEGKSVFPMDSLSLVEKDTFLALKSELVCITILVPIRSVNLK